MITISSTTNSPSVSQGILFFSESTEYSMSKNMNQATPKCTIKVIIINKESVIQRSLSQTDFL
ncbi:shikimate dehydrogenase [Streptococcus parauberis]|nr:shikimate dehydrogenase [Streptococcus parauberis]